MSGSAADEARRRAQALVDAAERDTRADIEHARRDAARCRELVEALTIQMAAGEWDAASASAVLLATWSRAVATKLDLAVARSIGLRAGRAAGTMEKIG